MIVGLAGLPGSGKDTLAKMLAGDNSNIISFADPLREMAWELLKWKPLDDLQYRFFKETKMSILPSRYENGREFLEVLSDSVKKRWGKDYFLLELANKARSCKGDVYITDLRFPMEFALVEGFENSKIIWCNYRDVRYSDSLHEMYKHNSQHYTLKVMKELELENKNKHETVIWNSEW